MKRRENETNETESFVVISDGASPEDTTDALLALMTGGEPFHTCVWASCHGDAP